MNPILKNRLLQISDTAWIPERLPDAIRLELLGELFLSGNTRTYSPHSDVIEGLADRYNIHCSPILPFPDLHRFQLQEEAIRQISVSGAAARSGPLWVHPDSFRKASLTNRLVLEANPCDGLDFYPLASHRAVLFHDGTDWRRVKLHLADVKISRYYRNLGGMTITHSVQVSRELKENWDAIQSAYQAAGGIQPGVYLDEAGVVLKNVNDPDNSRSGEWGSIERSLTPIGLMPGLIPLPLFSFYGENTVPGEATLRPLAAELCEQAGGDPESFLFETFMAPVIRLWAAIFKTTGILWEPHGQNVVMLCNPESLMPEGVAFRDPDTALSNTMRAELGRPSETFFKRNLHGDESTLEMPEGARSETSRVLDMSMGRNTFDYLARLFEQQFGVAPTALQSRCRELFAQQLPEPARWFPRAVYGYARSPLAEDRNCYPLVVREGLVPVWRPDVR